MPVNVDNFGAIGTNFLNDTFSQAKQTITFSELITPSDGQGGYTKIWQSFKTVDGFVIQKSASEPNEEMRLITKEVFKIHIEPFSGLNAEMKMTINGDEYRIVGINNILKIDQWVIIDAEKGFKE